MISRFRAAVFCLVLASLGTLPAQFAAGAPQQVVAENQNSPPPEVRKILARNKVKISTAGAPSSAPQDQTRPTFRVELPYDPQSSQTSAYFQKLYLDLLDALGKSYTLIDVTDNLQIDVEFDRKARKMSVAMSPLK